MKRIFKRTLSTVLALCSVLSLLVPSVLADESQAATKDIYYTAAAADTLKLGQIVTTTSDTAKGQAAYLTDSETAAVTASGEAAKGILVQVSKEGTWVAIELQGVKKGTYDIDFWNQRYTTSGIKSNGKFDVYVLPGFDYSVADRAAVQTYINTKLATATKLPTAWDCAANRDDMMNTTSYGKVEFESDGSYILVFKCAGVGAGNTTPSRMYLSLTQVDLVPATGTANVKVKTEQASAPVMPTEPTVNLDITDVQDQITSEVVLKDAVPSGTVSNAYVFEYNGHDYIAGAMRGGAYVVYDIDTQKQVLKGNCTIGTVRFLSMDDYGTLWISGASYTIYGVNLATGEETTAKITVGGGLNITSFNANGMTWDPVTKKFYFGTYNQGTIISFDPLTKEFDNLAGQMDGTPDDGKGPDYMYSGFGGLIIKDGYIYLGADGDVNADKITSHDFLKFSIAERKIVDRIDLTSTGADCWGAGGHFLGYVDLVGDVILCGSDSMLKKTVAIDISGEKMVIKDMGEMSRGHTGRVSAPIDGKVYVFGNTKQNDGLFEIDVATMKATALSQVDWPLDMVKLAATGGSVVTIEGNPDLPGKSLVAFAHNAYTDMDELYFYNIQTKKKVTLSGWSVGVGAGNHLYPIMGSPDGKYVFTGAYGNNTLCQYELATGNSSYFRTDSHQIDGLTWYNGKVYAGVYQAASIVEVDPTTGVTKTFFNLQNGPFNQARVHTLVGGDNKIFAGMIPDKVKLGGVLAWYDFETKMTYVAAGPNKEDVFYADTSTGGGQYVWRNAATGKIHNFADTDGDGKQDSTYKDENGVEQQMFYGLVDKQSINCIIYKDGYIIGTTTTGGGSGSTADPESSAVIFVYDVENMKLVTTLDLRTALSGYPGTIEAVNVVAADPDVDGKFWAITAGALVSFTFDPATKTITNVKDEFVANKSTQDSGSMWHPRSIVFDGEYMYVSLAGYGLCLLNKNNPKEGGYLLAPSTGHYEMVLAADKNLYIHNDYDIVRLNTAAFTTPIVEGSKIAEVQGLINALPENPTEENAAQVAAARAAYDALSESGKKLVNAEKLTAAEEKLAAAEKSEGDNGWIIWVVIAVVVVAAGAAAAVIVITKKKKNA